MRVAVCISGLCASNNPTTSLVRLNEIQREKFPDADFYYATWESQIDLFSSAFPSNRCLSYEEPIIPYHPYLDIPKTKHISKRYNSVLDFMKKDKSGNRLKWSSHHTKQILIHHWMLNDMEYTNYDVIVRTRFDAVISKNANFEPYLTDTFENGRSNCFGATKQNKFDELNEFDASPNGTHNTHMLDQMIIHPTSVVDCDLVNRLHNNHTLHAAETGWYQVLSMPHGENKHRDHDGWVNHDKNVLDKFLY